MGDLHDAEELGGGGAHAGDEDFTTEAVGVVFEGGVIRRDGVGAGEGDDAGVVAPAGVPDAATGGVGDDIPGLVLLRGAEGERGLLGIQRGNDVAVVRREHGPGGAGELGGFAIGEGEDAGFRRGEEATGMGGIPRELEAIGIHGCLGPDDFAVGGIGSGEADETLAHQSSTCGLVDFLQCINPGNGNTGFRPGGYGDARTEVGNFPALPIHAEDVGLWKAVGEDDLAAIRTEEGFENIAQAGQQGAGAFSILGIQSDQQQVLPLRGDVSGAGSGTLGPDDLDAPTLRDGIEIDDVRLSGGRRRGAVAGGERAEKEERDEADEHGGRCRRPRTFTIGNGDA